MDAAGARALEQRIADGKPVDDMQSQDLPRVDLPKIKVVYLHPRALPGAQRPWVYVRGPAGRLRRAR
jgi:hypothetical protein